MVTTHRIVLAERPQGAVTPANFRAEDAALPPIGDGQFLVGANYLSLDPYMRGRMDDRKSYAAPTPVGGVMEGEIIGTVLESRHPGFSVGERVAGRLGWQTHAISDGTGLVKLDDRFKPITTAVGVLGMPGLTAYSGLLTLGKPQPGETVVVAAATGPVGSLVGQIARLYGARAVGIAGGAEKCAYAKQELGFDAVVDHRSPTFADDLAAACPDGIDINFELVGGAVWQAVLPLLNNFARVPVCGLIAQYNGSSGEQVDHLPAAMRIILSRSVMMRGFIVGEFWDQRPKFLDEVSQWISEGKIRFREDIVEGLDNAPAAFMGLLEGRNFGKLVVKID
ncbi:NADP-dependent oxidoreductase [Sphingobium sp. TA15]|uniref:NADP-dependent oxidoreductase n=2 Tax=Sphingobium indicum TaxID=332055 RepID=A0A8E0WNP3_9SPHN|nr:MULTISPECIES: NADP-dependent oxidoreductase [Sphingobium]EPR12448.1 2-alkenal reductase [Sphingobium indicum IP26]BDD68924.1 NADP-dependent oxidoreductase [Sphingobium sp. TA15]EQB08475.1 2-alkenal reductase [Sphingobium sp. HDIP04]KER34425.1 NADP-dependent oxidoreductase [Sphingobium indicum F2]BAI98880.1 putative dehydrogenase/oxidoreductase [Sphingobium indicum UT26S]